MIRNIAISGPSGSGKTTVAEHLVMNHGYLRLSSGAACRAICLQLFGGESKQLLNQVTDAMRAIDEFAWMRAAFAGYEETASIVFDAMRFRSDYEFLRARGFVLLRLDASIDVRSARLQRRGQEFDPLRDDGHPAEHELDDCIFDNTLVNDGDSLAVLYSNVETIISSLHLFAGL